MAASHRCSTSLLSKCPGGHNWTQPPTQTSATPPPADFISDSAKSTLKMFSELEITARRFGTWLRASRAISLGPLVVRLRRIATSYLIP